MKRSHYWPSSDVACQSMLRFGESLTSKLHRRRRHPTLLDENLDSVVRLLPSAGSHDIRCDGFAALHELKDVDKSIALRGASELTFPTTAMAEREA